MPKQDPFRQQPRLPLADSQNNRTYSNSTDYLLLNAFVEAKDSETHIVKRPGWKFKKAISSIVTEARGFTYSISHNLYYAIIGDAVFKVDSALGTVTEIARKTPTAVSWGGGVATYTFAAAHGFIPGQQIKASGIIGATIPAGYTGILTILAVPTAASFTVTMPDPGVATLTNARASPILTTTGIAYFEETKNSTARDTVLLIPKSATTQSQLFLITNTATPFTQIITNVPTDLVGAPASIDGYLCVLSAAEANINSSNLEAPATFNALGFVSANTYADTPITLTNYRNQLACFKEYSTEFFYDAALPAPSSPLAKIPQQTIPLGCASAASVVKIGQDIAWLSRNQNGGLGVHSLVNGNAIKISTPYIDRILASMEAYVIGDRTSAGYISFEGHEFYILSIEGSIAGTQAIVDYAVVDIAIVDLGGTLNSYKRTLVYDTTTKLWHEWSSYDTITAQQTIFFCTFPTSGSHISTSQDATNTLVLERTTGDIYEMSPAPLGVAYGPTYKDGSNPITVKIVTNRYDGSNRKRKKLHSLEVVGDRVTSASTLSIRYSDDDYITWSSPRVVDLTVRSRLTNLGMFRFRAFELTHTDDTPLRLSAIELDVEVLEH